MPRLRPLLWPLAFALLALALHLACGGRLGFFRDELYFVSCGRRLALGYVDQPPLVALVARLGWWLSGDGASVARFRLPAYLCGASLPVVTALVARRLGGGPLAMALAGAASLGAALHLAQGHQAPEQELQHVHGDEVALALLAALGGAPRAFALAGLLLGLALLAKWSAGLLAVALLLGLLATPARRALASPWALAGVGIACVLALPSLWWQWDHGLPFLELLRNGRLGKNADIGPGALLGGLALEQGPLGMLLAAGGATHLLLAREARPHRWLGLAMLLVLGAYAAMGAKPYYLGPAFPPLLAAGAVALAARLEARPRLGAVAAGLLALQVVPALPIAIPLLDPADTLAWVQRLGIEPVRTERAFTQPLPQHQADQLGWPGQVAAVEEAVRALPADERAQAVVYTTNYGRASALDLLGKGLPPVISGHNQWFLWGVPGEPRVVVALGGREEEYRADFAEVTRVGQTPPSPHGMRYESEVPIFVLRQPRAPVAELFRGSRHYQ
jgi:4-amino-4-deoxy-L-arabinose transferase-like glycosyltransferase